MYKSDIYGYPIDIIINLFLSKNNSDKKYTEIEISDKKFYCIEKSFLNNNFIIKNFSELLNEDSDIQKYNYKKDNITLNNFSIIIVDLKKNTNSINISYVLNYIYCLLNYLEGENNFITENIISFLNKANHFNRQYLDMFVKHNNSIELFVSCLIRVFKAEFIGTNI